MTQPTAHDIRRRSRWVRPALRRLDGRAAENSLEGNITDGQLTFRTGS